MRCILFILTAFLTGGSFLILTSCTSRQADLAMIPIIECENEVCKGTLYDIEASLHNMRMKNAEGLDPEDEIVKYCLITNSECGVLIYASLERLYNSDTVKFGFLKKVYFVGDRDRFLEKVTAETVKQTVNNITAIERDIMNSCDCS